MPEQENPYMLYDYLREPDGLVWLTKRYDSYAPFSYEEELRSINGAHTMFTNDYELWDEVLRHPTTILTPMPQRYIEGIEERKRIHHPTMTPPVQVGLADMMFPYGTSRKSMEFFEYHTPLNTFDGLGADLSLPWTDFTFSAFPTFANIQKVLDSIKTLPPMFTKTMNTLKTSISLPTFQSYQGALTFPELSSTPVKAISALSFDLTNVSKMLTNFKNALTPTLLQEVLDSIEKWEGYGTTIKNNMPETDESIATNIKRVIRIAEASRDYIFQTHKTLKLYFNLFKNGMVKLKDFSDEMYKFFTNVPGYINGKFTEAITRIQEAVTSVYASLKTTVSGYSKNVQTYIANSLATIKDYVGKLSESVKTWVSSITDSIKSDVSDLFTWLKDKFSAMMTAIVSDMTNIKTWLVTNITNLSGNIKDNVTKFGSQLSADVKSKIDLFKAQIDQAKNDITARFNATIDTTKAELQKYVGSVQATFKGQLDSISATLTGQYKNLEANITKATASVTNLTDKISDLNKIIDNLKSNYEARFTDIEQRLKGFVPSTTSTSSTAKTEKSVWSSLFSGVA